MTLAPGLPYALEAASPTTQSGNISTAVQAPPAVRVVDIEGFPVEGTSVAWAVTAGGGSMAPASPILTSARGVSALTSWTLGASPGLDNNSVEASVAGLVGSPVVFTSSAVAPGPTSIAAVSATQQLVTVGTVVVHPPRVVVRDAGGAPVAGVPVAFAVTAGGGSIRPLSAVFTGANGEAALIQWTVGTTVGTNTVTATVSGLSGSPVSFDATGAAAGAAQISAATPISQSAQTSNPVPSPPAVQVRDAAGNAAGAVVTFAVASGGGSISPAGGVVQTDGAGVAALTSWTVGAGVGTDNNSVTATVDGLTGSPLTFLASGMAGPPPDPATSIAANSTTSQSGAVGVAVATPPSVIVRDALAVAVEDFPVTWVVTAGGGTVGVTTQNTIGGGIATVPHWILGAAPGVNTVLAYGDGLSGSPVTFTATAGVGTGAQYSATYRGMAYAAGVHKLYASGGAASTSGGAPNVVRAFDAATRRHLSDVTVGSNPQGMVVAPAVGGRGEKLYVGLAGGNVAVVATATDTIVTTITIAGDWARGVYVSTTDRVVFVQASAGIAIAINPADDTQSTLFTNTQGLGWIAYSPVADRLYTPRSNSAVSVYNPDGGALVTTISGFQSSCAGSAYVPGATDSVWVAGGSTSRVLSPITTSSAVKRTDVSIGTTGSCSGLLHDPASGVLLAGWRNSTGLSEVVEVNPATDTITRRDPAILDLTLESASQTALSGWVPASRLGFLLGSGNRLHAWHQPTRSTAVRTLITASGVAAPQVTVAQAEPMRVGDVVSLRRNLTGSFRARLDWPTQIAAMSNGLRREMPLLEPDLRGERNYVANPWARDWDGPRAAPGWDFSNTSHEHRWHGRDANTWTTHAAQYDGDHAGVTTVNLKGLTAGDVLLPGDWMTVPGRRIITRAVVSGGGLATVTVTGGAVTAAPDTSVDVLRPAMPDWLIPGQGVVVSSMTTSKVGVGVVFPIPYYPGLNTLWCTVEYWLWTALNNITHNTRVDMQVSGGGAAGTTTVSATDTTTYVPADGLVGPFSISALRTLASSEPVSITLRVSGDSTLSGGVAYIRRFQATLGPEANITPAFEFNASRGALFHAGQRALRDRGAPMVSYRVALIEDPDRPARPGVTADLRHPAAGLVATPRVLSVQRTIVPGAREADLPVVELDNRPPSLSRQLSRSGVA